MSNTSLRKIQVPALNHANFGKAIMEQFANIDANFQKLSNFELNAGIPGKSCLYVTINLAAPFVYPTSDINNPTANATDYNAFAAWMGHEEEFESALQDKWQQLKDSVATDYAQFKKLTGLSEFEYTRIAARMLWGSTLTFVGSDSVDPTPESLTGSLHAKYEAVEGPIECTTPDGTKETYHGNWLYEIFKMNTPDKDVMNDRAKFFIKHALISVPGRIIVAISPLDDNVGYYPVGSLEYWYIDPRFRNAATDRSDTSVYDISCVMHWTPEGKIDDISWPGHFEILEVFPTIRRGADGKYYWFINGLNTGVPVQGPAGKDGTPAQLVICQRVENVLGYDPEKWPNGELAVGPRVGKWEVPMSAFAGDSPRNLPSRVQYVNDIPSIVPQFLDGDKWPGWPKNLVPKNSNKYSRVTDFELNVTEHTAWLGDYEDGYALSEPENLFRIYRIVGREVLWTGPETSNIDDKKDPVNHRYDPSCDNYYFGSNNVSKPNDLASIQQLIELLDGATAIVLPGPAYQYDRTDSTYWFTTLRKVEWHEPGKPMNSHSGRYMLMAYCSDEERIHNALDEHTQAGMMQRLDPYAYKSNGDNRNKPRGLMLPIGSAYAAYTDGNYDWAWASHIMHSDCGGFTGFRNGRGIQQVLDKNQRQTVASDTMHNVTGRAIAAPEAQYTEVIGKRILHVGSVNDYRALNYVDNNTTTNWNGGVPGREELTQNLSGKIGNADFYGKTVAGGWFEGSELHVDEPMTITRYRDLHKRQRLLDVEGDVVIGPRMHKNGPNIIYRNRDGGLIVHSTISPDTGKDTDIFPVAYDPTMSIFNLDWYGGLELTHRAFYRTLKDAGKQSWQTIFGRWKYGENRYRAFYDTDNNAISTAGPIPRETHKHMFSFLGDDGIGARVVVAQDGLVVYNPAGTVDGGKIKSAFSVDAMGNIQTMGDEVRSNADDTLWVFHSRWTGPQNSYADMQYRDKYGVADINVDWSWLDTNEGSIKNSIFTIPGHNKLMIGTDHEVQFMDEKHGSIRRLERSWRATNFYPWKDSENTELCLVPMGWLFNFGPLDDTGYYMRTFMANRNNYFGQAWGSNELMPVTAVISPDINHFYGVLHVNGVDCMAVRSKAKENSQEQNQYISGRYGTQISHGLIVGPALRNIGNESGQQRRINEQDFINGSLEMKYSSIPWQEDSNDETSIDWGLGDDMAPMFDGEVSTPIAIWGRGSIFAEKTLIADEDLVVNRAATIRAQIRAKSFRRHNNSFNENLDWAFLLDNGYSSYNAPKHTVKNGCTCVDNGFMPQQQTPIVLDLGKTYGSKRLVRFGSAKSVSLGDDNEIVVNMENPGDRQICLLGRFPEMTQIKAGSFNELFKGKGYNAGRWVMFSDGRFATITFEILLDYTVQAGSHRTAFHGNDQYKTYGIAVYNGGNLDYNSEAGKQRMAININTGVSLNGIIDKDYLPAIPVDVHIEALKHPRVTHGKTGGSIGHSAAAKSWGTDGRDSQYGITFRLNTDGQLRIARAGGAALMVAYNPDLDGEPEEFNSTTQRLSFSFTYPLSRTFDGMKIPSIGGGTITPVSIYELVFFVKGKIKTKQVADDATGEIVDVLDTSGGLPWESGATVTETIDKSKKLTKDAADALDEKTDELINKIKAGEYNAVIIASIESTNPGFGTVKNKEYTAWNVGDIQLMDWAVYLQDTDILSSSTTKFAQSTTKNLFNETIASANNTSLFTGQLVSIPDGVFKNFGELVGSTTNTSGYVTSTNAKMPANAFSVEYWEEGSTSFLRLNIACDRFYHQGGGNRLYAKTWGIKVPGETDAKKEQMFINQGTAAWLPMGAKLPKCAIHAPLSGYGQSFSDWRDNRPQRGSGIMRLDSNGNVVFEQLVNPLALATGNENETTLKIVTVLFVYQSSDETMQTNYYTETDSAIGPGQDAGEVKPVGPEGGDSSQSDDNWLWTNTDCTTTNLKTWLNGADRSTLKTEIESALKDNDGAISNLTTNYGQATIEKSGNVVKVSLIVTAYKSGASDLSHRSINFTYDASGSIDLIGTYIIGDSEDDAVSEDDVTKLTTIDLGMPGITRSKTWFESNLSNILNKALQLGSINTIDITSSSDTVTRRVTLFGPGGYMTFEFRGHRNGAGTAWRVLINGQITSNIQKSGSSDCARCIMMFGTTAKFNLDVANKTVSNFSCDISCYYSNGPQPTFVN